MKPRPFPILLAVTLLVACIRSHARTSHHVKGACRLVAAAALADVCERMEIAGKQRNWESIAGERDALEREFERLNAWLLSR